jgi:hypothetical protein
MGGLVGESRAGGRRRRGGLSSGVWKGVAI